MVSYIFVCVSQVNFPSSFDTGNSSGGPTHLPLVALSPIIHPRLREVRTGLGSSARKGNARTHLASAWFWEDLVNKLYLNNSLLFLSQIFLSLPSRFTIALALQRLAALRDACLVMTLHLSLPLKDSRSPPLKSSPAPLRTTRTPCQRRFFPWRPQTANTWLFHCQVSHCFCFTLVYRDGLPLIFVWDFCQGYCQD